MSRIDIKVDEVNGIPFDIAIGADGDLVADDSFDTDILASILSDRRADASQIAEPQRRRGWNGDANAVLAGYLYGSLAWLFEQARLTNTVISDLQDVIQDSLQWFIDLGYATRIDVVASKSGTTSVNLDIKFYIDKDIVQSFTVVLFENSDYAV
jgi:phage gp46-like protein